MFCVIYLERLNKYYINAEHFYWIPVGKRFNFEITCLNLKMAFSTFHELNFFWISHGISLLLTASIACIYIFIRKTWANSEKMQKNVKRIFQGANRRFDSLFFIVFNSVQVVLQMCIVERKSINTERKIMWHRN